MALPGGVLNYRYGPGASQRRDLEYELLEAVSKIEPLLKRL